MGRSRPGMEPSSRPRKGTRRSANTRDPLLKVARIWAAEQSEFVRNETYWTSVPKQAMESHPTHGRVQSPEDTRSSNGQLKSTQAEATTTAEGKTERETELMEASMVECLDALMLFSEDVPQIRYADKVEECVWHNQEADAVHREIMGDGGGVWGAIR